MPYSICQILIRCTVVLSLVDCVRSQVNVPLHQVTTIQGRRLVTNSGQFQVFDKVHCCHICYADDDCVFASYNDNMKLCTNSNNNSITTNTVADDQWTLYLRGGIEEPGNPVLFVIVLKYVLSLYFPNHSIALTYYVLKLKHVM